jgi:hypothetical protein
MPTYPVADGPRRAYDIDGTLVRTVTGTTPSTPTSADIGELNGSSATGGIAVAGVDWLTLVFPSIITIDGIFLAHGAASDTSVACETSSDTTTGGDGVWAAQPPVTARRGDTVVSGGTWRSQLVTGLSLTCKGIRFGPGTTAWRTLHLYGGGTGQDPEGLVIRSGDYAALPAGVVDWGSTPQGSSADRVIVVANTSTRTAQGVLLTVEASEDTDEFAVTHYLSTDGGRNFAATAALGNIPGGSRSTEVTVRRVTPSTATTGARAARLRATTTTWV